MQDKIPASQNAKSYLLTINWRDVKGVTDRTAYKNIDVISTGARNCGDDDSSV